MKQRLYDVLRLFKKAARAVQEEQRRPAADTPERRGTFARAKAVEERLGPFGPLFSGEPAKARMQ